MTRRISRRRALGFIGGGAAATLAASVAPAPLPAARPALAAPVHLQSVFEIVHWHTLTASDGEVWAKQIENFNQANRDRGLRISAEVIPGEQWGTKLLGAAATGNAPDFGMGEGYGRRDWVNKGIVIPIDDLVRQAGLDLSDFTEQGLKGAVYDGRLHGVPLDSISFQMEINADHAAAAGLDESRPPATGAELLEWADRLTQRSGDRVTRSGFLMTGSGLHINLVWGVVAHQMGFRQFSDDLKTAMINPDAGKAAAQWVLDLFDRYHVATRDIADRYKAFGTGDGSIFWTGPWTISGYMQQGLNFFSAFMPAVGNDRSTRGELWNLEMYAQRDASRYEMTMQALKWLSDNTFYWSTQGRGPTVRKSVLARPDYLTEGAPPRVRAAFVEGAQYATFYRPPIVATDDFNPYTGIGFIARTMDPVWAGQRSIDDALKMLGEEWQKGLDAG